MMRTALAGGFALLLLLVVALLYEGQLSVGVGFLLAASLSNLLLITYTIRIMIREHAEAVDLMKQSSRMIERRAVQLQVAAEIARDATDTLDLDHLLRRTVESVRQRFGYYHAAVFLVDESGQYAVLRAAAGPSSEAMLSQGHRLQIGKQGIVGYVTDNGESRVALDVAEDTVHFKNPVLQQTRSEIAIPLKSGSRIIGALDVQSEEDHAFDLADITILQTLSDLLAVAIDKANLHAEVQSHAAELEDRVRRRTAELAHERAKLKAILDSMGEGVSYTEGGQTQYLNPALYQMVGADETTNNGYQLQYMRDDVGTRLTSEITEAVRQDGIWRGEVKVKRVDGTTFDAGMTCSWVTDLEDNPFGMVRIIRDISQEKALQEQMSRFVANASHELRTPITNLMTQLYLIRRQPHKMNDHLTVLEQVTRRMRRLVEGMLDLTRFERGVIQIALEPVIVQDLVQSVIDVQRAEADSRSIQLDYDPGPAPLVIQADFDRIVQVVTNLVINAIHYTPSGGHIVVSISESDRYVVIGVEDNGPGISPEHLQQVFQPFFRGQHGVAGTGLGLSISRTIVEQHGGQMSVDSELDQGSHFKIRLPL
jgi:PAS domain S-box-containing protein